jgi:hypothetical protein
VHVGFGLRDHAENFRSESLYVGRERGRADERIYFFKAAMVMMMYVGVRRCDGKIPRRYAAFVARTGGNGEFSGRYRAHGVAQTFKINAQSEHGAYEHISAYSR